VPSLIPVVPQSGKSSDISGQDIIQPVFQRLFHILLQFHIFTSGDNIARECMVNIEIELFMLWTIAVILFILWLLGFSFHVAGGLIHIILVIAVIVVIIRLVTGRAV
jgi:Family of unknown function (DUF5670)